MWKKKLASRKFWSAASGFATSILLALNIDKLAIEQVALVLGGIGALVAFIFAEGIVDKQREKTIAEQEEKVDSCD